MLLLIGYCLPPLSQKRHYFAILFFAIDISCRDATLLIRHCRRPAAAIMPCHVYCHYLRFIAAIAAYDEIAAASFYACR